MATKPSTQPRWAETSGGSPASNITSPTSGQQDSGWTNAEVPPSSVMNWWMQLVFDWIKYLADAILVATTGSGLDGVKATGDGAGAGGNFIGGSTGVGAVGKGGSASKQGGQFQAGSTSAPVVGSINLVPVSATPTFPANGDAWIDTLGNVGVHANGATKTLAVAGNPYAYYNTPSTTITSGATTTVNFSNKVADTDNAVAVGSGWNFTAPAGKAGRYLVTFGVNFSTLLTSGSVSAYVDGTFTGSPIQVAAIVPTASRNFAAGESLCGSFIANMSAGDNLFVQLFNNTSGSLALNTTGAAFICIHQMGS